MIALLLAAGALWAETWPVCAPGFTDDCFEVIQDAVDVSDDGDTVHLRGTRYAQSAVVHGKRLHISVEEDGTTALTGDLDGSPILTLTGGASVSSTGLVLAGDALPLSVTDSTLDMVDCALLGGTVQEQGGLLQATGSTVSLSRCSLSGGLALEDGGQVHAADSDLTLDTCTFEGGRALGHGGAIAFEDASGDRALILRDSSLFGHRATSGGGALAVRGAGELSIAGTTFEDNRATEGGAAWIDPAHLASGTIHDSLFLANEATASGGGALLSGLFDVARTDFCANRSWRGSALLLTQGEALDVHNSRFYENVASERATVEVLVGNGATLLSQNHAIGNLAGSRAFLHASGVDPTGTLALRANLLAHNTSTTQSDAEVVGASANLGAEHLALEHNLWWANEPTTLAEALLALEEGGVREDPMLTNTVGDGRCTPGEGFTSWHGAARDAGHPDDADLDASRADIGAWGGPDADPWAWTDGDGDGSGLLYDCDDDDPTTFPEATEIWYDDVDQDCDLASDWDADGDGVDLEEDCDDLDPLAYPGAPEIPYDDVDQDCDGADLWDADGDGWELWEDCNDDDASIHPGAGDADPLIDRNCDGYTDVVDPLEPQRLVCATGSPGPAWLALLLAGLALGRRRRSEPREQVTCHLTG